MNVYWVAAVWIAKALIASLISVRTGISVALIEIVVGAVVGNLPGHGHLVQQTAFTTSSWPRRSAPSGPPPRPSACHAASARTRPCSCRPA
jgi:hypothetical protein